MRTAFTWLLWIIASCLVALLLAMVVIPRLLGWVPLTVLTGSMDPAIPPGSQVIVKPVNSIDGIAVGDIVTYMPNPNDETLVTHRVVGVQVDSKGEHSLTVKGDANNAPDPTPVTSKQLRGVVVYHIPWVGYIALKINAQAKIVTITVLGIGLIVYAVWQVIHIIRDRRRSCVE